MIKHYPTKEECIRKISKADLTEFGEISDVVFHVSMYANDEIIRTYHYTRN